MLRTQIYLTEELYREVAFIAKKEKKKKAQVIREALDKGLKVKKKTLGQAIQGLLDIAVDKGPSDLSTNHDKYLYEED